MKKLSFPIFISLLLAVSLNAQYFSATYPGAGNGLSAGSTAGGYFVTTTKGVLKVSRQGQAAWSRHFTGIFLLESTSLNNGQMGITGFKGDDVYFNTIDTNGILQQSSVYALTNYLGQQDVGQTVRRVGGYYCLAGTYRKQGVAGTEAFFMCLNSSHNIAWAYKMEGPRSESFSDFQPVINGGGFSLLANTDSDGSGATDILLLRTANDGSLQGYSLFGGSGEDKGWAVRPLSGGGFAVVGETGSFGSQQQGFLARLDGSGNLQWARVFMGTASLLDVEELADGSLVLLGNTGSVSSPGDITLLKTDASGQLQWARSYGDNNTAERAGSLKVLPDGGFLITGGAGTPAFDDLFLARTDADGNVSNCTGNTLNATAASITFQAPQPSGQLTYNLATGQASRWSVVTNYSSPAITPNLCIPVGTATTSALSEMSLNIFPNPSPTLPQWAIECPEAMTVQARLTDAYGRLVVQEQIQLSAGFNEWRPGLSGLTKGVYIASLSDGEGIVFRKFVIQ